MLREYPYKLIEKIMKLEVINCTTEKLIKTYSVPDLSMLEFQEWKMSDEVVINLNQLSKDTASLDSKDPETDEFTSIQLRVDFYLPDPIKNQALSQFAKSQTSLQDRSNQIPNEVNDAESMAMLKSRTVLSAVVTEILQNHPHSGYKVRISDE